MAAEKKGRMKGCPAIFQNVANKKIGVLTCVNHAADPFVDLIKAFAYNMDYEKMKRKFEVFKKPFAIIFFFCLLKETL